MRKSLLPLLLTSATAFAANAALDDFAWQAQIAERDAPLQRVELPLEVLLDLTRGDLADVAVFNADGKRLPHSIARVPEDRREVDLDLAFHEFGNFQQRRAKIVTARRQARDGDSVAELETTEAVPVQTRREEYLVDLRPHENAPRFDRLELEWRHEPADQWLELTVMTGNEIDNLRILHRRKRLSNHESGDPAWRSIGGLPTGHRYVLLTPSNRVAQFELQRVTGHYAETDPPATLGHLVDVTRVEEDGTTYYRFDFPSAVRAEGLRIIPGDAHSVISGDLYATWDGIDERRRIVRGFRQHNIDSDEIKPSDPIALPQGRYKQFWFDSDTPLARTPQVVLEYAQYEVVFLGDGVKPYRLAWGNYASEAGHGELDALLDGDRHEARERGAPAALGPVETAGGPARLAPKTALPWQKWLLWALLIAAAAVTGRMAFRLYREMNAAEA